MGVFFFFSSRRRHTRFDCDWSSDVCSSDLELIGHAAYQRIHGGVISAGLDSMGGLAVMAAIGAKHMDDAPLQRLHRFSRLGTIDLRVDYLRPGIGSEFILRAEVLRLGSRVANTRMEFLGADGSLLSTGTAAYIVS